MNSTQFFLTPDEFVAWIRDEVSPLSVLFGLMGKHGQRLPFSEGTSQFSLERHSVILAHRASERTRDAVSELDVEELVGGDAVRITPPRVESDVLYMGEVTVATKCSDKSPIDNFESRCGTELHSQLRRQTSERRNRIHILIYGRLLERRSSLVPA